MSVERYEHTFNVFDDDLLGKPALDAQPIVREEILPGSFFFFFFFF